MGEIAEAMLTGIMCEMCGEALDCDSCADMGIPMYCSNSCAKDREVPKKDYKFRVCNH